MNLRRKAATGLTWTMGAQGVVVANQLVANIILARMLDPTDFGLFAMTVAFSGFATLFVDFGLGPALLRVDRLERRHEVTTFWAQLAMGFALTITTALAAPLVAYFFSEPRLTPLFRALSPQFIVLSLAVVPQRIEQRALRLRRVALVDLVGEVAGTGFAIVAALMHLGPYALVVRLIGSTAIQSALMLWSTKWKPSFTFDSATLKELMGFASGMTGTLVVSYWTKRLGDVIVGRFSGTHELGLYNRAYAVTLQPFMHVTQVLVRVFVPVLVQVREAPERFQRTYLRGLRAIAFISFPATVGLASVSGPFVAVAFGEKWLDMTPILALFSIVTGLHAIETTSMQLLLLKGRSDSLFRWKTITSVVSLVSIAIGARWGAVGVAAASVVRSFVLLHSNLDIPNRMSGIETRQAWKVLAAPAAASVIMGLCSVAAQRFLVPAGNDPLRLAVGIVTGAVVYATLAGGFRLEAWTDIRELLLTRATRRAAPGGA